MPDLAPELAQAMREASAPGCLSTFLPAELEELRVWSSHLWTRVWIEQERRRGVGSQ
jgi:hypothetical protein